MPWLSSWRIAAFIVRGRGMSNLLTTIGLWLGTTAVAVGLLGGLCGIISITLEGWRCGERAGSLFLGGVMVVDLFAFGGLGCAMMAALWGAAG